MKAMIFAAGLGTRLRPITNSRPKALVEIDGKPLLQIAIEKLKRFGYDEVIVNIHHFGEQIIDFLKANHNFDIHIEISDERDLLLDTGGGLKKAAWFFDDGQPFLVHNVDILSGIDFNMLRDAHLKSGALATLAVQNRPTSRSLLLNPENCLAGWRNNLTGELKLSCESAEGLTPTAFSGIHMVSPGIFPLIEEKGVFSIIDVYLRLARKYNISTFNHDQSFWMDLGRIEHLQDIEEKIKSHSVIL